jgi:son of sevenless-like protein
MVETANEIVRSVHRFLAFAHQAGVELIDEDDDAAARPLDVDKTAILSPTSSEPPASPYRRREPVKAKSLADLRSGRRLADPRSGPTPVRHGRFQPHPQASGLPTSPGSSSGSTDEDSPTGPLTPAPVTVRSRADVLRVLEALHDQLLSTIAAFIGHVHAHSRTQSHPSSHAHLIDMTRETIERVRDLLALVEAIEAKARARPDVSQSDRDLVANSREALYVATTSLVTAARVATSDRPPSTSKSTTGAEEDDDEKAELLQSATAVLRAGGDCAGALKLCLAHKESLATDLSGIRIPDLLASSSSSSSSQPQGVPFPRTDTEGDEGYGNVPGSRASLRTRHTLSMLGRKATSLSCLRDKYEKDGSLAASTVFEAVDEGDTEDDTTTSETQVVSQSPEPVAIAPTKVAASSISSTDSNASSATNRTSDLSTRRGLRTPTPLRLQGVSASYHGRNASGESASATSTVTSLGRSPGHAPSPVSSAGSSDRSRSTIARPPPGHRPMATAVVTAQAMSRQGSRASASTSHSSSDRSNLFEDALPSSPRSSVGESHPVEEGLRRPVVQIGKAVSASGAQPPPTPSASSASASPTASVRDPSDLLSRDYDRTEVTFNSDGHVTGGTLRCLVERMTLHDTTIDPTFSYTFFLTFRIFTTPLELVESLVARFDLRPPETSEELSPESLKLWHDHKAVPVRLRVYNLIKTWLEAHWRPETDQVALEPLAAFAKDVMAGTMSAPSHRLLDLIQRRQGQKPQSGSSSPTWKFSDHKIAASSIAAARSMARAPSSDRMRHGSAENNVSANGSPAPAPLLSKNALQQLRLSPWTAVSVTDIDPLELARQITILESRVYLQITPAELLGGEFAKKATASAAVHVKSMSALSTRLTGWIAETILSEHDTRKRTALLKYFIKLGDVRIFCV